MDEKIFLTGATGYIGAGLLQKWLTGSSAKLVLLVRSKHGKEPRDRITDVLEEQYPGAGAARYFERIEVIEGDISLDRFGLKESEYRDLSAGISHIIHCAAAARFDLEIEDARNTNVGGTRNIIDFARTCSRLRRIDYIGTAYVAGRRKGVIRESELDEDQEHNNTYESSKFEAERLVRESSGELPIAILRPSIVICDSRTGRASSFNGFYRALRMYRLGLLKILPGHPSSLMDLVPVDYVTDAVFSISGNMNSAGKCYHLTAGLNNTATLEEIRDLAGHYFGKKKFDIIPPDEFNAYVSKMEEKLSGEEREAIAEIKLYTPYLTSELRFDNTNTKRDAPSEVPSVRNYFGRMAGYIIKNG